jgi:ABC-2 type transport system permease protein
MSNKTLLLTRTLIRNGEGFGIKGMKNKVSKVLFALMLMIILPGLVVMFSFFVNSAYSALTAIGQEGVVISWGIAIASTVIFLFGIFYIAASFYFSRDVEVLLYLPLKPRQIVGAKFLTAALFEYLITAAVFLPVVIIYGIRSAAGILFYIYSCVVFVFIPVVPLCLAAVLVMVLMRFTNASKQKDTFSIIAGTLALILGLGINLTVQKFIINMNPQELEALIMKGENTLALLTSGIFPTARWAVSALLDTVTTAGFLNLMLYAAVSAAVYIILLFLGEMVYLKGVVGLSETVSKRNKQNKTEARDKFLKKHSALRTYTMLELKLLFRTPIYFLNCVIVNFIWPVLLLIYMVMGTEGADIQGTVKQLMNNPDIAGTIFLFGIALFTFVAGFNGTVSTSISREGQELFIKKYIPVSYRTQILAKVLSGFILSIAGAVFTLIAATAVFKLPLYISMLILAAGWMGMLFISFVEILLDLYNPKLDWDSEQKAVKQNLNVVYSMIISSIVGGLTIYAALQFSPGFIAAVLSSILVYGVLNVLVYLLLRKKGVERFGRLEG